MANWRKIHIKEDEWTWTISKGCSRSVVIREPNRKCHTVLFYDIDPESYRDPYDDYDHHCPITPGKIKDYIERNLL